MSERARARAARAAPKAEPRFRVTHRETVLYQGDDEAGAWAAYHEAQAQHPSGVRITGTVPPSPAPRAEAMLKGPHGGARKGAGRKPVGENIQAKSVSLPAAMIEALRAFGGGNLSAGIRRLHDEHFGSLGDA